jgi:hypothetical protein
VGFRLLQAQTDEFFKEYMSQTLTMMNAHCKLENDSYQRTLEKLSLDDDVFSELRSLDAQMRASATA